MKKLRLLAVLLVMALAISALTGCLDLSFGHIEDINGEDDISLAVITAEEIVNRSRDYKAIGLQDNIVGNLRNISCDKFSGITTLNTLQPNGNSLKITFDLTVLEGNFYIAIVKNGQICNSVTQQGKSVISLPNATGDIFVVIAGESAKFALDYQLEY